MLEKEKIPLHRHTLYMVIISININTEAWGGVGGGRDSHRLIRNEEKREGRKRT